jgi:hypothetical protein
MVTPPMLQAAMPGREGGVQYCCLGAMCGKNSAEGGKSERNEKKKRQETRHGSSGSYQWKQ